MTKRRKPNSPTEEVEGGDDAAAVRSAALRLLARREHSAAELENKLLRAGYAPSLIGDVLSDLQGRNWLSDARFAQAYAQARIGRGYGPLAIRAELRRRGIEDAPAPVLQADWQARIEQVRRKRFGPAVPKDLKERARQARFLQARGYTQEQIRKVLAGHTEDE